MNFGEGVEGDAAAAAAAAAKTDSASSRMSICIAAEELLLLLLTPGVVVMSGGDEGVMSDLLSGEESFPVTAAVEEVPGAAKEVVSEVVRGAATGRTEEPAAGGEVFSVSATLFAASARAIFFAAAAVSFFGFTEMGAAAGSVAAGVAAGVAVGVAAGVAAAVVALVVFWLVVVAAADELLLEVAVVEALTTEMSSGNGTLKVVVVL